jgi:hypothetical protein
VCLPRAEVDGIAYSAILLGTSATAQTFVLGRPYEPIEFVQIATAYSTEIASQGYQEAAVVANSVTINLADMMSTMLASELYYSRDALNHQRGKG